MQRIASSSKGSYERCENESEGSLSNVTETDEEASLLDVVSQSPVDAALLPCCFFL